MSRIKQIIIPIALLTVGVAGFMAFSSMKKPPAEKVKEDISPIVSVEEIQLSPLSLDVNSYGIVRPKYQTTLVSQVSGQIVELSDKFVRGGFVKKGELLARIDSSDYDAALIDAQAKMATAKAALETELAQGKVAEREWKAITHTSPTELSLRKPQLAKELASVKAAQASELRAQRNVERTEVRAPYDAMIARRDIGLGSFVSTGNILGEILGTGIAEVRLPIADEQLQFLVSQGANAKVDLNGDFAGKRHTWSATIIRNEGVIDNTSRMSYLVAEVHDPYYLLTDNQNTPLRFGSYVNAVIEGKNVAQAAIVPRHLVVNNRVAILDEESKLLYVDIDILRENGEQVVVGKGLSSGDRMITSALDFPINGMKLSLSDPIEPREKESLDVSETQLAISAVE